MTRASRPAPPGRARPARAPRSPLASRSASASSPASSNVTNVGTNTAESAPAASSSKSTFDTELDAWKVFPRNVVPSTAATTSTRAKPNARERAVAPAMPSAARATARRVMTDAEATVRRTRSGRSRSVPPHRRQAAPARSPRSTCPCASSRSSTVETSCWSVLSPRIGATDAPRSGAGDVPS